MAEGTDEQPTQSPRCRGSAAEDGMPFDVQTAVAHIEQRLSSLSSSSITGPTAVTASVFDTGTSSVAAASTSASVTSSGTFATARTPGAFASISSHSLPSVTDTVQQFEASGRLPSSICAGDCGAATHPPRKAPSNANEPHSSAKDATPIGLLPEIASQPGPSPCPPKVENLLSETVEKNFRDEAENFEVVGENLATDECLNELATSIVETATPTLLDQEQGLDKELDTLSPQTTSVAPSESHGQEADLTDSAIGFTADRPSSGGSVVENSYLYTTANVSTGNPSVRSAHTAAAAKPPAQLTGIAENIEKPHEAHVTNVPSVIAGEHAHNSNSVNRVTETNVVATEDSVEEVCESDESSTEASKVPLCESPNASSNELANKPPEHLDVVSSVSRTSAHSTSGSDSESAGAELAKNVDASSEVDAVGRGTSTIHETALASSAASQPISSVSFAEAVTDVDSADLSNVSLVNILQQTKHASATRQFEDESVEKVVTTHRDIQNVSLIHEEKGSSCGDLKSSSHLSVAKVMAKFESRTAVSVLNSVGSDAAVHASKSSTVAATVLFEQPFEDSAAVSKPTSVLAASIAEATEHSDTLNEHVRLKAECENSQAGSIRPIVKRAEIIAERYSVPVNFHSVDEACSEAQAQTFQSVDFDVDVNSDSYIQLDGDMSAAEAMELAANANLKAMTLMGTQKAESNTAALEPSKGEETEASGLVASGLPISSTGSSAPNISAPISSAELKDNSSNLNRSCDVDVASSIGSVSKREADQVEAPERDSDIATGEVSHSSSNEGIAYSSAMGDRPTGHVNTAKSFANKEDRPLHVKGNQDQGDVVSPPPNDVNADMTVGTGQDHAMVSPVQTEGALRPTNSEREAEWLPEDEACGRPGLRDTSNLIRSDGASDSSTLEVVASSVSPAQSTEPQKNPSEQCAIIRTEDVSSEDDKASPVACVSSHRHSACGSDEANDSWQALGTGAEAEQAGPPSRDVFQLNGHSSVEGLREVSDDASRFTEPAEDDRDNRGTEPSSVEAISTPVVDGHTQPSATRDWKTENVSVGASDDAVEHDESVAVGGESGVDNAAVCQSEDVQSVAGTSEQDAGSVSALELSQKGFVAQALPQSPLATEVRAMRREGQDGAVSNASEESNAVADEEASETRPHQRKLRPPSTSRKGRQTKSLLCGEAEASLVHGTRPANGTRRLSFSRLPRVAALTGYESQEKRTAPTPRMPRGHTFSGNTPRSRSTMGLVASKKRMEAVPSSPVTPQALVAATERTSRVLDTVARNQRTPIRRTLSFSHGIRSKPPSMAPVTASSPTSPTQRPPVAPASLSRTRFLAIGSRSGRRFDERATSSESGLSHERSPRRAPRTKPTVPRPFSLTGSELHEKAQKQIEEARKRADEMARRGRVFKARPMPDFSKPFPKPHL